MNRNQWCVLALLTLASGTASSAEESGFYASGAFGIARYPRNATFQFTEIKLSGPARDNEDFAWTIAAGYRLNRHVAFEASYLDLGETDFSVSGSNGALTGELDGSFAAKGPAVVAIGSLPLGNWEPYIKIGVLFAKTEFTYEGIVGRSLHSTRQDDTKDVLGGVGIGYNFNERWQASADVIYVSAGDSVHANILYPSAGLLFRF